MEKPSSDRLCHQHGGEFPLSEDIPEGTQFWCPVGREVWTFYRKPRNRDMYRQLDYGKVTV